VRADVSGLLDSASYRCETVCKQARLFESRGCTGVTCDVELGEKIEDIAERAPEHLPRPAPIGEPTYPQGWIDIAAQAKHHDIPELGDMLSDMPQYEARPIARCLNLLRFDGWCVEWMQYYALLSSGHIAAPEWTPRAYASMMGAIRNTIHAFERARIQASRRGVTQ